MPRVENRNAKAPEFVASAVSRVRDFTDLQVWQLARDLRRRVYDLVRAFPADEKYAITQQLRRAATSITANIAEGFGRYSFPENIQFCRLARGSACELRDHLITAEDEGYLTPEGHQSAELLAQRVVQTLNGYIRSTKPRQKSHHLERDG
jgi:four helix bundle protein